MPRVNVGIELGTVVLEGRSTTSYFRGTRTLIKVDGLPFESVLHAFRRPLSFASGAAQLARRLEIDVDVAHSLLTTLRQNRMMSNESKATLTAAVDVESHLRKRAKDARFAVRVGPLRARDLQQASRIGLLQFGASGARFARGAVCLECAALWEVQSDPSPTSAARLANSRMQSSAVAIDQALLRDVVALLRSNDEVPPGSWYVRSYSSEGWRIRRQPRAAGCSSCPPPVLRRVPLVRRDEAPSVIAEQAIRRLGVSKRESLRPSIGSSGAVQVSVDWGIALRMQGKIVGEFAGQVGVGDDPERRRLSARAEVVERASAILRRPDLVATPKALGSDALPMDQWALYSAEQYRTPGFPFPRITERDRLDWFEAHAPLSDRRILVPASLTMTKRLACTRFVDSSSNGVATHTDWKRAARGAMLEVIERDALQRAWYLGRGAQRLVHPRNATVAAVRADLAAGGWGLELVYLKGRGRQSVVVAIAEMRDSTQRVPRGGSVIACGAGALTTAIEGAVRELRMAIEAIVLDDDEPRITEAALRAKPRLERFWTVENLIDIMALYLNPAMRPAMDVLLGGDAAPPPRDASDRDDYDTVLEGLSREGLTPLLIDLSDPRTAPFVTCQAVIIGTQPLAFGQEALRLGSGLLPTRPPPRRPPLPTPGFRIAPNQLNPYVMPLA
jgi:ribosomal protein S12 methylthiotransferase accessory factor